jgi:hypothetical protein
MDLCLLIFETHIINLSEYLKEDMSSVVRVRVIAKMTICVKC